LWRAVRQYSLEQLVHADELVRVQARVVEWLDAGSGAQLGMAAEDSLSRPTVQVKRSSRRPEVLSEREHTVVQLIAGGRSNREIADELVITKKTAEAHVSHILTKLGLCSRVQIATWSLQQGVAEADASALRTREP